MAELKGVVFLRKACSKGNEEILETELPIKKKVLAVEVKCDKDTGWVRFMQAVGKTEQREKGL